MGKERQAMWGTLYSVDQATAPDAPSLTTYQTLSYLTVYNGANWLSTNSTLTYGASGLNYFNISGTAGTTANENVTPTSNWYHILRMNHANSRGYFVDIAAGLDNANGMYWRRVSVGTNYGWYKILDSNNYTTYCATASHTHSYAGSSSAGGAANSVANSLTLSYGGTSSWTYNGSAAKTINIKAGSNVTVSGDSSGNITISSTDTNTHYSSKNIVNSATTSTANTSTALTNGNVYLNHIENGSVTSYHKISGSGASTVTTDASGNIIISSTNTTYTSLKNPNSLTLSYYPNTASSASTSWTYDGSAAKTLNLKYGTYINVSGDTSGNISFSHTTSGVTAGSYGATSNATLSHSGTFKVPYYTVDSYGHLTAAGAITYTLPSDNNTTYSTATYSYLGLIKPWYSHTAASTGPTTGSDSTAVAVNTITSTSGKYYAIEMDSNGRAFVNVPWSNTTYTFTANNPTLDWSTTSTLGTIGGTTFKVTMPANPNTDTKVTSVDNHYSPSANSSYALGATSAATLSFGGSVITGLTRDAKGHLTGVVTGTLPSNPNTDYKASSYNTTSTIYLIGATS
jgi:hypothetical protein